MDADVQSCVDLASAGSIRSSQTLAAPCITLDIGQRAPSYDREPVVSQSTSEECVAFNQQLPEVVPAETEQTITWLETSTDEQPFTVALLACIEMIGHHKTLELSYSESSLQNSDRSDINEGSRMIVVSWLVEVAEEFGLQQETLHSAVALLDRFLATSNGVPRCVLQLVAVGCVFLAAKQLEVQHPSVAQLVAVAANSFTAADLLRVERILLDALDFKITSPTGYNFLHLLTQATLAALSCSSSSLQKIVDYAPDPVTAAAASAALTAAVSSPVASNGTPMEVVVSLAMYLTELALLDQSSMTLPCSKVATAALMLAFAVLRGGSSAWPTVLAVSGYSEREVAPLIAALDRLHVAAQFPPTAQLNELLKPLKIKFGQECWCKVSTQAAALLQQ